MLTTATGTKAAGRRRRICTCAPTLQNVGGGYPVRMPKGADAGVIDCMVEVWISPVTFLLTLLNAPDIPVHIKKRNRRNRSYDSIAPHTLQPA